MKKKNIGTNETVNAEDKNNFMTINVTVKN